MVAEARAFAAVRKGENGTEAILMSEVFSLISSVKAKVRENDKESPHFAKIHPVLRIVSVKIIEQEEVK